MKLQILSVCFIISSFVPCFAGENPLNIIKRKDTELMEAIRQYNDDPTEKNRSKLNGVTSGIFDFDILSRNVLPKKVWDSTNVELHDEFTSAFREMVVHASATNLATFKADSTLYDDAFVKDDSASVTSRLWSRGHENQLEYKMVKADGSWKVVDLVINDLSTARNYKEQFSELLKKKSLQDIVDLIKKKTDDYTNSESEK